MSEDQQGPSAPPSAAFRLEGERPVVARLSKKALLTIAAVAGLSIGGVLVYALAPRTLQSPPELLAESGRPGAASLVNGPRDYSDVPKIGPPLPGDLGRPILAAQQRERWTGEAAPMGARTSRAPAAQPVDRRAEEQDAARSSGLFLGEVGRAAQDMPQQIAFPGARPAGGGEAALALGQAAKRAFLAGGEPQPAVSTARVKAAASRLILQAGSVLPAALMTGIRSDLPGQLTAQVTENIYDSLTGRILLIPQGSKLLGEYDSDLEAGQTRVMMIWTRLLLPGGASLALDRLPGADAAGFSGLQDRVNRHWGNLLGAAAISTLLGIGGELGSNDEESALVRALRRGGQNSVVQAGNQIVQREIGVPPTLTIRPGHPLRVIIKRDLIFDTSEEQS